MTRQALSRPTQGNKASALRRLKHALGFVFDMDGTLVLGDNNNQGLKPLPGALALIDKLNQDGVPYVVFTNGTPRSPALYAEKLRGAGFPIEDHQMLTPVSGAVDLFLKRRYRRVCVLGGEGISAPLEEAGIEVVPAEGKPEVDAVFAGWFREFTMAHLEAACHAVWQGAKVYSASRSLFFATANGRSFGTSRMMTAVIKDLTGARINVIGKPSIHALRCAGRRLDAALDQIVVVGDDPALEPAMALRGGSLAVAVATGIGRAEDYAEMEGQDRPHLFLEGVDELLALL